MAALSVAAISGRMSTRPCAELALALRAQVRQVADVLREWQSVVPA